MKPNLADDTPTTSNGSALAKWKFKKFRDNSVKRKRSPPKSTSTTTTTTTSIKQVLTRRLLRNIKKSKCQRRKLNFSARNQLNNDTLEEGELIDDTTVIAANTTTDDDDDDCIFIEPIVELILIDDDTPSSSQFLKSLSKEHLASTPLPEKSVVESDGSGSQNLLSSPPLAEKSVSSGVNRRKKILSSTPLAANTVDLTTLDLTRTNFFPNNFETIVSEDTFMNYTKVKDASKDIISLDETLTPANKPIETADDSVIFIDNSASLDFIPLESDNVPNPIYNLITPRRKKIPLNNNNDLFTMSERKQLTAYNNNAYNPSAGNEPKTQKRMVIIDGCNVAFHHSLNKEFSVRGLSICLDYFIKMGHEVKAVVPQFRLHRCSDPNLMLKLHQEAKIVLTPCKKLPGMVSISYDDRFVLQLASELDAVIVSNDNYRDLINENSAFKKIIENRVIGFSWCNDIFLVAKDPYGKWGPSLQCILNRT